MANKKKQRANRARLPNGSQFHACYDAGETKWQGMLIVPEKGQFAAKAHSVFMLLIKLDDLYRKSIGEKIFVEKETVLV